MEGNYQSGQSLSKQIILLHLWKDMNPLGRIRTDLIQPGNGRIQTVRTHGNNLKIYWCGFLSGHTFLNCLQIFGIYNQFYIM